MNTPNNQNTISQKTDISVQEKIKVRVRVTTEAVYDIYLHPIFGTEEGIEQWRDGLWHIDDINDIAKYAASMIATGQTGANWDGTGVIGKIGTKFPREPDTPYKEVKFEMDIAVEDS